MSSGGWGGDALWQLKSLNLSVFLLIFLFVGQESQKGYVQSFILDTCLPRKPQ